MTIKNILVIDDSPTERYLIAEILSKAGYRVTTIESAEAGIEKARAEPPDLILMDIVMPGIDGYRATRMLIRDDKTKNIPIIVCTSKKQKTDMIWSLRQGAQDFVSKPIDGEELLAKIAAL
ncbi:MAG: response regulator [Candidatus Accumulibacter sp.]|jgi:twitching motility two-component system response regulator PilH|nr:response regulator [Accumulibacter sp.]